MAKPMIAKYKGECRYADCSHDDPTIQVGEQMKWLGKGQGAMHWDCAVESGADSIIIEQREDDDGKTFTVKFRPPKPIGKDLPCDEGCGGTGLFVTGVNNGKVVSNGQPHFRCNGKGFQNDADRIRNYWYDVKYRKVYA